MRRLVLLCVVLALVAAVPVMAGEGKKCSSSTQECLDYIAVKMKDRGWVGIEYDADTMTVTNVIPDSPAKAAGFMSGDVMVAVNDIPFGGEDGDQIKKLAWNPGSHLTYTVKRGGSKKDLDVTLGQLPDEVLAQWVGNHMIEDHAQVKVASLE